MYMYVLYILAFCCFVLFFFFFAVMQMVDDSFKTSWQFIWNTLSADRSLVPFGKLSY